MKYRSYTFSTHNVNVELSFFGETGHAMEYHLMLHVKGRDLNYETQLQNLHRAYREFLEDESMNGAKPVLKRYFLSDAANQAEQLQEELKLFPACPTSILQQSPLDGSKIALWCYLIKDTNPVYEHYWMAGLGIASGNSEEQTHLLLQKYELELQQYGCLLERDCIRTWFFVQNVDVNYAGLVKARRENFVEQGLTEQTHYIASTGIEGRHANPNVYVLLDAYAVKGLQSGQMKYLYALSHMSPTAVYGVTFERGVCVLYGDRRQLYISGTASIDSKGEVLYKGDVVSQARRMCENVEKLLEEGGSNREDLAQIIIYLRDAADYSVVKPILDDRYLRIPKQFVLAPVCRPTWLIEMECIALRKDKNDKFSSL
ncbi:Endoribonuclease L-PSP [Paludibacter propionicigenes WB4]|uniref:Endoribonuclease L-PSP n=1 Tax=Paludibacter propionicigenes (strain DSM 17365 / JCM 13257 / WB4) TaxID=694427 RepID=E4T5G5_PALPW|nr:Rid family hydrolase [Paludibacter propionicigenes]ADQ79959.1 Endoribonuclease L-PSP [Paludibacter propionicigenes WB4]